MRRWLVIALLVALSGCGKKVPVSQTLTERDRDLYLEDMKSLEKSRFTAARLLLQNLMQTYPESEFAPKAKYAEAESFYLESGHSNLVSAETSYRNFITFFPDNELADDAQLKIALTHIKQLQKPDRDDTQARMAEYELTAMINKYADSPLLNEAKEKLRYVQEVLAESIFGPARQYYLRRAYPAVIDRCDEITKKYPDFTGMDRVLYLLAESKRKIDLPQESVNYYAQIVRDYPLSDLAKDSKKRLTELRAPVPEPNPIALNRARLAQPDGKGFFGWFGFGGGSGISDQTGAASVKDKGGQLSIEPEKP